MVPTAIKTIALTLCALTVLSGADIDGTIIVKRKLTKRRVTAPVEMYGRGTTVQLKSDAAQDPLAFERQRVVIYLDGNLPGKELPQGVTMAQEDRRFVPQPSHFPTSILSFTTCFLCRSQKSLI